MFIKPTQTIFYSIEKAIKTYRKFAQKRLMAIAPDITLDQALILLLIEEDPRRSQVAMSELLFKDYASLTRMISLLVQNDYLQRRNHPADGRRSLLLITAKGQNTLEQLRPVIANNRAQAIDGIEPGDLDKLHSVLNTITENCEKAWAQPQDE